MQAVFAEFEHEILRMRVHAGISEAHSKGKTSGKPKTGQSKKMK